VLWLIRAGVCVCVCVCVCVLWLIRAGVCVCVCVLICAVADQGWCVCGTCKIMKNKNQKERVESKLTPTILVTW